MIFKIVPVRLIKNHNQHKIPVKIPKLKLTKNIHIKWVISKKNYFQKIVRLKMVKYFKI